MRVLNLQTATICDVTRVEAQGTIDSRRLGDWRETLQDVVARGAESIVIDIARVTSWTAAAQAALIRAMHLARESGRSLSLVGMTQELWSEAEDSGLARQLPVADRQIDLTDAVPDPVRKPVGGLTPSLTLS
jgi:anti-anti-sigma factor